MLQLHRIPYLLFDRDLSFSSRSQGYALTLQQAIQTFDDLNLVQDTCSGHLSLGEDKDVFSRYCTTHSHVSLAADGRVLGVYGPPTSVSNSTPGDVLQKERECTCSDTQEEKGVVSAVKSKSKSKSKGSVNHAKELRKERNRAAAASRTKSTKQNIHIPRQDLRHLLLQGCAPSRVKWGHSLVGYTQEDLGSSMSDNSSSSSSGSNSGSDSRPDGLLLHFANQSTYRVSGLVGADGIYSNVRFLKNQFLRQEEQHRRQSNARRDKSHNDGNPFIETMTTAAGSDRQHLRDELNYLDLFVILGIAKNDIINAPYSEREISTTEVMNVNTVSKDSSGFNRRKVQWVDGATRVFSMPYDRDHMMWQLSFRFSVNQLSEYYTSSDNISRPEQLKSMALEQCSGWHSTLVNMIKRSEVSHISGHPVYDRDPVTFEDIRGYGVSNGGELEFNASRTQSGVTILGDAFHPMSPFKGQGANQALLDAQTLGRSIINRQAYIDRERKRNLKAKSVGDCLHENLVRVNDCAKNLAPMWNAFATYEKDVIPRATKKVLKSRTAARVLHDDAVLVSGNVTRASVAEGGMTSLTPSCK